MLKLKRYACLAGYYALTVIKCPLRLATKGMAVAMTWIDKARYWLRDEAAFLALLIKPSD